MCTSHTLPTHGIVIGFENILLSTDLHDDTVYRDYKHREQNQYFLHKEEKYTRLTVASFEGMAAPRPNEEFDKVCRAVQQAGGDKLKIFLLGHGLADREFIFSETYKASEDHAAKKRTIPQLAGLVKDIVGQRCNSPLQADNTRVVMLACVFGRSLTGDLKGSNAWKLHEHLKKSKVFVELVARTEYIALTVGGLFLAVNPDPRDREPSSGSLQTVGRGRNVSYAKVVCKYDKGNPVIKLCDDERREHGTNEVEVKRVAWFQEALHRIVNYATDEKNINHVYLRNAVNAYMSLVEIRRKHNDHEYLYQLLCYLAGRLPEKPLPDGYHPVQAVSSHSPLMGAFYEGHNQASAAKMPRELSDDLIRPIKHRKGGPHVLDPNTKSFLKGLISDYPKEAKH